jgi:hypothetical protein
MPRPQLPELWNLFMKKCFTFGVPGALLIGLLIALTVGPSLFGSLTRARWSISRGWLTAKSGGERYLRAGNGPPSDVRVNDAWLLEGQSAQVRVDTLPGGGWTVTQETAVGVLVERIVPHPALGPDAWLRSLEYTNRSTVRQDLTNARLRLIPERRPGGLIWHPEHFWMGEASASTSVCVAYQGGTDFYSLSDADSVIESVVEAAWRLEPGETARIGSQGVWLGQAGREPFRAEAQRWFKATGLTVPSGMPEWAREMILYEAGTHGHIESRFSDVGGFAPFERQLDYLADLGVSAIWFNAVFRHRTPPDPVQGGWNHHAVLSFKQVDPALGGLEGFKQLVSATRQRGIHVLGETIPWGGLSAEAAALPQWWLRDRSGQLIQTWGHSAMDYASPEWQQVMRESLAWLAREAGIEGARIDVADGGLVNGMNWGSPRARPASVSGLDDAKQMLAVMREGLSEGSSSPVLIPETPVDRPEYFAVPGSIGYGNRLTVYLAQLGHGDITDAAALKVKLRDFFERERGGLPEGALVLRMLNNHDTVAEEGRLQQRFGVGLARALYGVLLSVPGVPMMYQEEELGSLEALRQMNWGRRRVLELVSGAPDYLSVEFAPEVFTALRVTAGASALGLVNLSGRRVSGTVALPATVALGADARAYDAVSGREVVISGQRFDWTLEPYETSLLRLGQPPVGDVPARRFRGEAPTVPVVPADEPRVTASAAGVNIQAGGLLLTLRGGGGAWTAEARTDTLTTLSSPSGQITIAHEADGVRIRCELVRLSSPLEAPTLTVRNAAEWLVSGRTALLRDGVLRRHFPFPAESQIRWTRKMCWGAAPWGSLYDQTCPSGRLWQSVLEPLHPDRPALGFTDAMGQGVIVETVASTASNMVLTDRSDEETGEPYQLEVRFYADDPDLSPRVRLFGVGQPWVMDDFPVAAAGAAPQHLELKLKQVPAASVASALSAERLPVASSRAVRTASSRVLPFMNVFLLPEPMTLTWSNLAPAPGTYRIALELRHSEKGPGERDLTTAYQVSVNGQSQPLEWLQLNTYHFGDAWFGWAVTPPLQLDGRRHELRLTTSHHWTGLRPNFKLIPVQGMGMGTASAAN